MKGIKNDDLTDDEIEIIKLLKNQNRMNKDDILGKLERMDKNVFSSNEK